MTTLSHSISKSSVYLAPGAPVQGRGPLIQMPPTLPFWFDFLLECAPSHSGSIIASCPTLALSHSVSIIASNVPHSFIPSRLLYQMCCTPAFWLDYNIKCAPLSHSGSISVSNVACSRVLFRFLSNSIDSKQITGMHLNIANSKHIARIRINSEILYKYQEFAENQ
jgi:hypothetical protein